MKAFLKFDYNLLTKKILEDKLTSFGYKFSILGFGEIEFYENVPEDKQWLIYASEADMLNVIVFGKTAKQAGCNQREGASQQQLDLITKFEEINESKTYHIKIMIMGKKANYRKNFDYHESISFDKNEDIIDNSVFEELKSINPNILKSLYILSFSKYEGFDSFDI